MLKLVQLAMLTYVTMFMPSAHASDMEGQELYTQVNMHSLKGEYVTWVNYGVDSLIPVNTKVLITSISGSGVEFTIKESGTELSLKNSSRSGLNGEEWANKHFGINKVNLKKFNAKDQKGIEEAKALVGMSKKGVLIARGYPPAHVTPNLDMSEWMYWHNRWNKKKVVFKGDTVKNIID